MLYDGQLEPHGFSFFIVVKISTTKKQHYVWRRYLSAWKNDTEDRDIWTCILKNKTIKKIGLMDVAQSSYFYKLEELSDEELTFLKEFTDNMPNGTKVIAETLLAGYLMYAQLRKDIGTGKMAKGADAEHEIKKIEAASFEKIQSQIELMGASLLDCKSIDDLKKLYNEEYEILFYLWVQYFRTRGMKDGVVASMADRSKMQAIAQKAWPFFNLVVAMQVVENMVIKKDYRFVYLHNVSNVPFITGDQPVINTLWDEKQDKIEVFYPLSPVTALMVCFNPGEKYSEENVDKAFVREKNALIAKEAYLHIFANGEQVLKDLLN